MADKPDDRLKNMAPLDDDPDVAPKIFIIVDNKKMPRPGLETFFAQTQDDSEAPKSGCTCDPVGPTYCSCNKVCSCVPVCSCVGHSAVKCSCVGHTRRSGGSYGGGCRCAPVH